MTRRYRILHLSDTHVSTSGPDEDGVDAPRALRLMLEAVTHVGGIDVIVTTGDIADDGSEAGCAHVRDAIGAVARDRGVPHVYATGNHDRRDGFTAALGSGHLGPDSADVATTLSGTEERAAVSMVSGLRIVTLDSLVPGQTPGVVSRAQLDWLTEVLHEPAPDGTVIGLHHPPVHIPDHPTRSAVLQNPDDLRAVVQGRDVHAVLCGHLHLQLSGMLGSVPVWATPGVVTRIDLTAPAHLIRGVRGAGATIVDLGGENSPTFHLLQARDPHAGELVYLVDPATGRDVAPGSG